MAYQSSAACACFGIHKCTCLKGSLPTLSLLAPPSFAVGPRTGDATSWAGWLNFSSCPHSLNTGLRSGSMAWISLPSAVPKVLWDDASPFHVLRRLSDAQALPLAVRVTTVLYLLLFLQLVGKHLYSNMHTRGIPLNANHHQ